MTQTSTSHDGSGAELLGGHRSGERVYHTVAVSIRQQQRTLVVLTAVGVRRRSLLRLCVVETLVLAMVGGLVTAILVGVAAAMGTAYGAARATLRAPTIEALRGEGHNDEIGSDSRHPRR